MIGEKTNQGINYSEKLAESVDHLIEYTKVIAEKADNGIEYSKVIAEKTDQNIEYSNYIATEISNRFKYQTYINEQVDNLISHNDYIVEGTSSIIEYTDYLKEQTENLTNYMNHVVEKINEGVVIDSKTTSINESIDEFRSNLDSKIDSILSAAKVEKKEAIVENTEKNLHFLNFLSESKRNQFESLNEEAKEKIVSAFSTNKYYGSTDAERLFESVFIGIRPIFNWLTNMPEKYKTMWNGLNESQKNAIKAQASLRVLDTQYKIDDFWSTRDLRPSKIEAPINESLEIVDSPEYKTPTSYLETVEAELRRRFKK
jgi:hypothetical protein